MDLAIRRRPSWDETWMQVAEAIAARSTCIRKYGAVIVDATQRIVATGYNGPPASMHKYNMGNYTCIDYCPHAVETPGDTYANCVSIHAEANALLFCDRRERMDGVIYVTSVPCWDCAKMIANSGLGCVVFNHDDAFAYRDGERVVGFLKGCGLEVQVLRGP